jgi:hypothetical protein
MDEELAPEDLFRLNVLLAQDLKAVRIDESAPALRALTAQGEATLPLNPNCRADRYLRRVREFLSGHALGSPGGYPVHLSRWTRHGQMDGANLGKLLLTGEPEAVVAVVHSPALDDEIAAYAWWAMPTIENARLMLRRAAVARGGMGGILTAFLVEHLPFLQEDDLAVMDTVAVLLNAGTLSPEQREAVWRRGKRQNSHYVAFLERGARDLPAPFPARADFAAVQRDLAPSLAESPACAALQLALSEQGQTFLAACIDILERPDTQEVVSRTLNAIGQAFAPSAAADWDAARSALSGHPTWVECLHSLEALATLSDAVITPIFARSTANGSLMRRKIEPVTTTILAHCRRLLP